MESEYVKIKEDSGNLIFYRPSTGEIILKIDGANMGIEIPPAVNFKAGVLTLSPTEIGLLDGVVAGAVLASKVATYDAEGKVLRSSASPAAAGNAVGNATPLTAEFNYVTAANGAKGVVLPVAKADEIVVVVNSVVTAGAFLNVYAITGSQINALGSTVAFALQPGQVGIFIGRSATLWNVAAASDTVTGLTATAAELNLLDDSTILNATASRAAMVDASKRLRTAANNGAVTTGATTAAVEIGDGERHTTILTLTAFAVGLSGDNANLARGASLYSFPAGEIIVEAASINVALTLADAVQTDTPEIGLGTVPCAGEVQATLGAVGATAENIFEGVAVTNVNGGTSTVATKCPTAAAPFIIPTASTHVVALNVADGWADLTAASAITATGTIILSWKFMS